jgi:chitinase
MNSKIIAYFPSWSGEADAIEYEKLTHINYSFVRPGSDGSLGGFDGAARSVDAAKLHKLVKAAHAKGVKVGIAVGGWSDLDNRDFEAVSKPALRGTFIEKCIAFCDEFDLDGIDIDWEYPTAQTAEDFETMMRELAATLRPQGRFLSAAVIAQDDEHGLNIRQGVFRELDMLNIMAYDWHYQKEGVSHSPLSLAESALDYWLKRGCPREKAILGVPFYGRSTNTAITYKELIAQDQSNAQRDNNGSVWYNGVPTIRKKTELALSKGGGIMFWEISQDTSDGTSLLSAIHETAQSMQAVP